MNSISNMLDLNFKDNIMSTVVNEPELEFTGRSHAFPAFDEVRTKTAFLYPRWLSPLISPLKAKDSLCIPF